MLYIRAIAYWFAIVAVSGQDHHIAAWSSTHNTLYLVLTGLPALFLSIWRQVHIDERRQRKGREFLLEAERARRWARDTVDEEHRREAIVSREAYAEVAREREHDARMRLGEF